MRGALSDEVTPALRHALAPTAPALDPPAISSAMYAIARDCRWTISGFHWCPIYCTFHLCFAQTRDAGSIAIAIGAHAPMLALSASSKVNDELRYVDDASFGSAAAAYESSMPVLPAAELRADLSEADRAWLVGLSAEMKYNLNYWRPQNVGDVIFNTWD